MQNKPKILFVGNCQATHLKRWRNFFEKKFSVYVLTPVACGHKKCLQLQDLVPENFKWVSSFPGLGFFLRAFYLKKYLKIQNFQLIHLHSLMQFGTRIGLSLLTPFYPHQQPLIISTWGSDVLGLGGAVKQAFLKKIILEQADLVTATSQFLSVETRSLAPGIKNLEIVPFGVDLKVFNSARYKQKKDSILRVGFFKHLTSKYGPDYLLRSFKIVEMKLPSAELFIAGKGEMDVYLQKLAKNLGIAHKVNFLGFVANVAEAMSRMDITVMPSVEDSETFGVAAVESQALEIPVVASRVGGVPEVVKDGETGILVSPREEKPLAEAITKILSDDNLRLQMGKAGRKFVAANYNWEENTKKMEDLYLGFLNSKNGQIN